MDTTNFQLFLDAKRLWYLAVNYTKKKHWNEIWQALVEARSLKTFWGTTMGFREYFSENPRYARKNKDYLELLVGQFKNSLHFSNVTLKYPLVVRKYSTNIRNHLPQAQTISRTSRLIGSYQKPSLPRSSKV